MSTPSRPLRICMAAGHFLPQIGGVERYVYNLSRALVRQGHQVAVVASQLPATDLREQLDGIDLFRLPSWQLAGSRLPIPVPFSAGVRRQLAAIRAWRPDIFVIHTHLFVSNVAVANLAARLGRPCILINHGSGYVSSGNPVISIFLKYYERVLAALIKGKVQSAFGVSKAAAQWLSEFGIDTSRVIANGVDVSSMPDRSMSFRTRMGISSETCLVAYAARLLPQKGADTLVDAFTALKSPNSALVVAGDGPMLEPLRAKAAGLSNIHFLGATKHNDVLRMFGAADIMAYPSRYPEGQPTTVLEAGAMGCAVVATPMGGTAELIDDPRLGIIVEDVSQLRAALRRLIEDSSLRLAMGTAISKRVRADFDWQVIAMSFVENVRQLVDLKSRAATRT